MTARLRRTLGRIAALGVIAFTRALTAARAAGEPQAATGAPCVYFANHASHGDFVLLWTVLPPARRSTTRPVAGADYWRRNALRRFIAEAVFDAVLIERRAERRTEDPVDRMARTLDGGRSLILFPEGTRNTGEAPLMPLRTGLYHLAEARPQTDLVPVWLDNARRVLPKGESVPLPLLCTVRFGRPLTLGSGEAKEAFLERAGAALLALAPAGEAAP